ncbi:chondroitinase family polysaccharide lyase [Psychromonas aquimarina]|uniref:chondroitinase family polysaccharide lyase n=1 Tax=Psychromonas aquimarina TaxID=444919 RepID=UPI0004178EAF|nr:chondroitinase family polysaccharide lyase [Psychromonas aquimarina]
MRVSLNKSLVALSVFVALSACQNESEVVDSGDNSNLEPGGYMYFFEQGVPESITTSGSQALAVTTEHYKDGQSSLEWVFDAQSQLTFDQDIGYKNDDDEISPYTFMAWIYNEKAVDKELTFSFGTAGSEDANFKYSLDFQGWRGISVPFRDMDGTPAEGMNQMVITAPDEAGTILLDQVMMSVPVDNRYPTPDYHQPFVNPGVKDMASKNWTALLMYDQMLREAQPEFNFDTEFDDTQGDSASLYVNFDHHIGVNENSTISQEKIDENLAKYTEFEISYNPDGTVKGKPLTHPNGQSFLKTGIVSDETLEMLLDTESIRTLGQAMKDSAKYLRTTNLSAANRAALESVFLDATRYVLTQGWEGGSGYQIITHVGYQTRELFDAMFVARNLLADNQLLEGAQQSMMWFNAAGRVYEPGEEINSSNVDILNTQLQWMIKSFLLLPDQAEREAMLTQHQEWLSKTLLTSDGLAGGFKTDGSTFHHSQHYPAYGKDAFGGLSGAIYGLGGSPFQISEESHEHTKDTLMTMRIYTKELITPIVLSGRHPTGEQKITSTPFKWMALAGSPDGSETVDSELAAAYANLAKLSDFEEVDAEDEPVGVWAMNYASMAMARGQSPADHEMSWLATARGFSRYLVGNETYAANNLYGRYLQYGQLEITPSDLDNRAFSHDGWNWNQFPGTTTINLPNEQLRAVLNQLPDAGVEEMLLSTETYSGANTLDNSNAMFAMKLHGHKKYEQQSLRARKSYFMFGNEIIALGSGIQNSDSQHLTETTLFQHSVADLEPVEINDNPVNTLGTEEITTEDVTFLDPAGNRYYVTAGGDEQVRFTYQEQSSNAQGDASPTSGLFAAAVIEHGTAPTDGQYEYAIKVEAQDNIKPVYTVLQRDNQVHAVRSADNVEAYAFFEAASGVNGDYITASNTPSQVMAKSLSASQLQLSVVNPDLAIYSGQDPDQIDENGEQVEVSIYSRPWRYDLSQVMTTTVTVKGLWELSLPNSNVQTAVKGENTDVTVTTIDAAPQKFALTKK